MTPNVVLIFCYGDSLTHGSSSPPTFSSFPIGPHLERELNQSIDNVTLLIMARSRFCYFTSLLVGVDSFYSHSDNLMFEVNGETRNSSNEMLRFSSIVCQNRQYYPSLWQQFCLAAHYCWCQRMDTIVGLLIGAMDLDDGRFQPPPSGNKECDKCLPVEMTSRLAIAASPARWRSDAMSRRCLRGGAW